MEEHDIHGSEKTSVKLFGISCLLQLPFLLLMMEVIRDPKAAQGASTIGGCFFCLGTSLNIAGAGYGLAGLLQQQRRLAFWGLLLNIMLPIIIYLVAYLVDRAVVRPNP